MGDVIHVTPCTTAFDTDRTSVRVHTDALHARKVDYHPVVTGSKTGAVVSAAADGEQEIVLASESYRCDHVRNIDTFHDHSRALINHRIVYFASFLVTGVFRKNDIPAYIRNKIGDNFRFHERPLIELVEFDSWSGYLQPRNPPKPHSSAPLTSAALGRRAEF